MARPFNSSRRAKRKQWLRDIAALRLRGPR